MISANTHQTERTPTRPGVTLEKLHAASVSRYLPFPVDALPDVLGRYVGEAARAIGCDPTFITLPLLAMLASCIGTTRCAKLKRSWRELCIVWATVIASSGTRKTPALSAVLRSLRRVEARAMANNAAALEMHQREMAEYERSLAAWKRTKANTEPPEKPDPPPATRYIIADVTVEAVAPILLDNPRGLLLARDELAGWIGDLDRYSQSKGGDVARWLSSWSGEPVTVDRRTSGTIHVPIAAVSVTGTIQPEVLRRVLGRDLRENGLAARLLLAMPPRRAGKWTDADISQTTEDALAGIVERLLTLQHGRDDDGNLQPVGVPLDDEARAAYIRWHNDHEALLVDEAGDLAAALAKLRGYCARLALLVQLVRWAADEASADAIDAASMASAIELVQWFGCEARRIYVILDEKEEDTERRRLVEWIDQRGGSVTVRDLTRNLRLYRGDGKAATTALDDLATVGLGVWSDPPPAGHGGRPSACFTLFGHSSELPPAHSADADETPPHDSASGGFGGAAASVQQTATWSDGSPIPADPPADLPNIDPDGWSEYPENNASK